MRMIFHEGEEGGLCTADESCCMMDNLSAAVVRSGDEPFKSYYDVEIGYHCYSAIDPARSFCETLIKVVDERCSANNNWPASDAIWTLMGDLKFDRTHLNKADLIAFWTMFPKGVSGFLSLPYMRLTYFNNPYGDIVRVLNNPWFYRDPNASEKRLVEIAKVDNFHYALDRAAFIASPVVLAKEISLLNFGCNDPIRVNSVAESLVSGIAIVMDDWGLRPTESESVV